MYMYVHVCGRLAALLIEDTKLVLVYALCMFLMHQKFDVIIIIVQLTFLYRENLHDLL